MSEAKVDEGQRMTLRRMPFSYAEKADAHWNKNKPEFSQVVNAASLAMPYLEPYLIRSMRKARSLISDKTLQEELDQYVFQEAQHYKQHKMYNDSISANYKCAPTIEQRYFDDYKRLGENKSLRFNLAYAEGFESMALAIGQMLIEERELLFGDSESTTASLVLWHFVEEIEHKNVAFDVFDHIYGNYFWRMWGLIYATGHIFLRTGQSYRALLKEDGLWENYQSRKKLLKVLFRIFANLTPRFLKICKPNYHPSQIADPTWALDWAELYRLNPDHAAKLDTGRLDDASPQPLSNSL
ncbi:MAG: metal-dependent hydrolase [Pseudomonadales bacterium]|nr:metal-dependent hydrolase [Pseudomonadales bacterium]